MNENVNMGPGSINMKYFRVDRILKKLYRMLIFDVWSMSSESHPNENIKVLFICKGNELDKNYFRSLIFNENYNENYLGKMWVWRLFYHYWRIKKDHDLIIVKTRMNICNLFRSTKRLVIPDWISCEIDLDSDLKSETISKKAFTAYIRLVKKSDFSYRISKDPLDFKIFYNNMYLPYIIKRHGDLGLKVSLARMQNSFENGELLLIKDSREIIAGALIDYAVMNGIPRMVQIGILNGDFDYVKKGALTAIYYYAIEYLRERKHKKLSVGYARPFIRDGLTKHKLYWGANIICETSKAFLLCVLSRRKCVETFLLNNPFISKNKSGLSLMTFTGDNSEENRKFDKYRQKLN